MNQIETDKLQFVIQRHSRPGDLHWDLMLQKSPQPDGDLETYHLSRPPQELAAGPTTTVRIADHPPRFLTYEGPVNNGIGSVEIADRGLFHAQISRTDTRIIYFEGRILSGKYALARIDSKTHRLENIS